MRQQALAGLTILYVCNHVLQQHSKRPSPVDAALIGGVRPAVRWYDARQRCGLRLLATWLKVPWKMFVNFECLLVHRLLLPPEEASKAKANPWEQGVRAAKIGAASLGIGAIFAVTGITCASQASSK